MLLDLDELDQLSSKLRWFSYNRPNLFSLYDTDHGDGTRTPLRAQIESRLDEAGIDLTGGRVWLLCMPRTFGYCFNPLSIFFCHRADGTLVAIVYQVHNTFAERHSYIIAVERTGDAIYQRCRKLFYVSPFMDMDMRYDFRIVGPSERIVVDIVPAAPGSACYTRFWLECASSLQIANSLVSSSRCPRLRSRSWLPSIGRRSNFGRSASAFANDQLRLSARRPS